MAWRRGAVTNRRHSPPLWPVAGDERGARVLVEHPDPAAQHLLATGLRDLGYAVVTCGGPRPSRGPEVSCPLLRDAPCGAVTGADIVVSCLDWSEPESRSILRQMVGESPRTSVVIGPISRAAAENLADVVIDGIVTPTTVTNVVAALEELGLTPSRHDP